MSPSPPTELSAYTGNNIIPRSTSPNMFAQGTVLKVASAVDSQNVIHVRETPASGKTILSQLLRDHYLENHRNVFLLEIWKSLELFPGNDSWLDSFASAAKTVILMDEAQGSYTDYGFWNTIIKELRSAKPYDRPGGSPHMVYSSYLWPLAAY
ncbi:predicted protein [Aspergillus nidulans FGSC A4]|uniref:Uncharacterized protein n=1 Tax=Emericella nidulans (strain FGSC A4 / ATCC 38163 / CBS 112.46 / NRRL 194 / M139) TaxID=227321 RepID=Q5B8X3_EMENI|nr:hypothetical protein [Aspergillus nidulans FGSC A4]EAA63578.1 predicted protein [Aspergillus nidulans FGSC A4]CBF83577.1 TPA: conserved hypothetical protein [Aspergillus nidulans FGSC A4]|eukprot:XP_660611.1 predicted protein [Aspergillus nidulans FGSC A4]